MIDLVALDADDTLWHNEPNFTTTRDRLGTLLAKYGLDPDLSARLYDTEKRNLEHFGYGVKGFVLSMIETSIELTNGRLESADVRTIIDWGRAMLASPIELLEGVQEAVEALAGDVPLILVTKGDLLDQETKLARSGLGQHFQGIEIVSEKNRRAYERVMRRYAVAPDRFVMVGNSLKSDILPALDAGAHAVLVPYQVEWVHERVAPEDLANARYHQIAHLRDLPAVLNQLRQAR
ncbi:MAG TPA: HAD family hydrolase [Vicinamibacterales bacterium]